MKKIEFTVKDYKNPECISIVNKYTGKVKGFRVSVSAKNILKRMSVTQKIPLNRIMHLVIYDLICLHDKFKLPYKPCGNHDGYITLRITNTPDIKLFYDSNWYTDYINKMITNENYLKSRILYRVPDSGFRIIHSRTQDQFLYNATETFLFDFNNSVDFVNEFKSNPFKNKDGFMIFDFAKKDTNEDISMPEIKQEYSTESIMELIFSLKDDQPFEYELLMFCVNGLLSNRITKERFAQIMKGVMTK